MLGAICGDILGSTYEFEEKKYENQKDIILMCETDRPTDDTAMTVAVADWLMHDIQENYDNDEVLKERLAKRFVSYAFEKFKAEKLGFGGRFWNWLCRGYLIQEFEPYNSFGNGSGMRVSPVGWFFDTMEDTMRFAKLSADVTHNHPEGEKGAMCIAAAIFMARHGKTKTDIKEYLYERFGYEQLLRSVAALRKNCQWSEVCQDTVPMAVVAFLESTDYESAIKLAISYGSDSDTIADMAGTIAEAYYKEIPAEILRFCLPKLPKDVLKLCTEFVNITKK